MGESALPIIRLVERKPMLTTAQMLSHLVPPPQFAKASFENYQPDQNFDSQEIARDAAAKFMKTSGGSFLKRGAEQKQGLYLDGGFGVGKTHLLAATWHKANGVKYFGTFMEITALVGALGYAKAEAALKGSKFIAIDEFELDDPGDTMIMTRLLGALMESGTYVMATSNTPPGALGEGRFAAADFVREISAIADRFNILRIDGVDYRHRENEGNATVTQEPALTEWPTEALVAIDDFGSVIKHLRELHPSKYILLVEDLDGLTLKKVSKLDDQNDALRFVAFVDRLYDADIPIKAGGLPLDQVFSDEMLDGGYRKKYLRAYSRLVALTHRETKP